MISPWVYHPFTTVFRGAAALFRRRAVPEFGGTDTLDPPTGIRFQPHVHGTPIADPDPPPVRVSDDTRRWWRYAKIGCVCRTERDRVGRFLGVRDDGTGVAVAVDGNGVCVAETAIEPDCRVNYRRKRNHYPNDSDLIVRYTFEMGRVLTIGSRSDFADNDRERDGWPD